MEDLTKIYIDLSKCTEEQQKHIEFLTGEKFYGYKFCHLGQSAFTGDIKFFGFNIIPKGYSKTELTYTEFIKLFEGGEDNNGWIKIESEADLPKDFDDFWVINDKGEIHMTEFNSDYKKFHDYFSDRDGKVTHYQPIQKPLPPKF